MVIMKTIIKKIDKNQIDTEIIAQAGEILENGGLVAFPTETVYGLGANALNEEAAKKTYEAKGRPSDNPLIVHIADIQALDEIVEKIPEKAKMVAEKFWPGPLTLIFEKSAVVPFGTTGGLDTVAVRMPEDEIARALIRSGGGYISAPSANTSGRPSPTSAEHVAEDLDGKIDMIIDGGNVEIGVESTILDMTVEPPMILRPGAVTKEMLEEVIGEVAVDRTTLSEKSSAAPKAPGMKYRHYAPKAQLVIINGAPKEEAAKKTYEAKGRPSDNPLIVHIADIQALDEIVEKIPEKAKMVAEKFWPGPLTLIFEKSAVVPFGTTGGLDTVAVRMPEDEIARALIRSGGGYISAPSANTSGRPSPTSAEHVAEDLDGKIDMIIDGGNVEIGVESTILDMTVEPPMILRPGAVTKEMLEEVIGEVAVDRTTLSEKSSAAPKAPGMKYRHYAPKAQLVIINGAPKEAVKAIRQLAYRQVQKGNSVGIIATSETADSYTNGIVKSIGTRANENSIAKNLYKVLREFDEEEVTYIFSEAFAMDGIGNAIMNRLVKAAGHQIIEAEEITRLQKYRRVLFVSNSDNCRGPMAAEILRNQKLLQEYEIDSRGMIVLFPEPANQKAEAIMKSQQMTLEFHEATAFSEADLDDDTLVLTLEEPYKWKIVSEYDNVKNVFTLNEYIEDDRQVLSTHGQPLVADGENFELLRELILKLADKLNKEAKRE